MKVCYVISTPSEAGGANRSLLNLVKHIFSVKADFSCIAIISRHGTMEEALRKMGIVCYVFPYANAIKSVDRKKTLAKRVLNAFASRKIRKLFRKEKVELVHNNSFPTTIGMEVALNMGIPYICHVRENIWDGLGMEFFSPKSAKRVFSNADYVVSISEFIKKAYEGFAHNKRNVILRDGINLEDYYCPDRALFQGDRIELMMVGVINPQKGQAEAIRAVRDLVKNGQTAIHLTLIGAAGRWNETTEYAERIKYEATHELSEYVDVIDAIDDTGVLKEYWSKCDINLVCSSAEGLGRTTIEGMLSGALTVAANAGATPEIVNDGETGLLYSRDNQEELINAIRWAISHKEEAKKIARAGQRYAVEHFGVAEYTDHMIEIYKTAIEEHKGTNKVFSCAGK